MLCKHFEPCSKYWCLLNTKKAGSSCRLAILSQQNIKLRTGNSKTYTRPFKIFLHICANVPRFFYERLRIFRFSLQIFPPTHVWNGSYTWQENKTIHQPELPYPRHSMHRDVKLFVAAEGLYHLQNHTACSSGSHVYLCGSPGPSGARLTHAGPPPPPPAVVWLRDPSRASAGLPELTGLLLH